MYHRAILISNTLKLDITLPLATHSLAWRTQARLSDTYSGLLDPEGGIVKLALRQHFTRFRLHDTTARVIFPPMPQPQFQLVTGGIKVRDTGSHS